MVSKTIDMNKKYTYRSGGVARILCTDCPHAFPVISMDEKGLTWHHTAEGTVHKVGELPHDLIEVPEKKELWINLYEHGVFFCHQTKSSADERCTDNRLARVKVVYVEGQYDE